MAPRLRMARPVVQLRQGRRDWYRITNAADGASAEIAIYDEIGYFGVTAGDLLVEIKALDVARLDVRINSPGGDAWDGLAIYNSLRDHPATVTTYVDGLAASAASVILQAGDRRVAAKASQAMIHSAHGLTVGNAVDHREMADLLDQMDGILADVYAGRAGGDAAGWRAAMKAETWYSGDEALAAGLVDEVGSAAGKTADNSWDLSVFAHAGRDKAPAPVIPAPAPEFTFDAEAFAAAMKEAVRA